jgi:hypothetical protein
MHLMPSFIDIRPELICLPRDFWRPQTISFLLDTSCLPTHTDLETSSDNMLSILRKARLKDKEMRILML